MHSQQDAAFNDSYIAAHRLDRRKAVIDRFYLTSVTNRAFNEYFGNVTYGCLTEFVNPGEKESFIEFIDGFDGVETEKCFLFKNGNGEYRLNLIKLIAFEGDSVLRNIDIEMLDIDSIVETNYKICDDIARERLVMGLTGEYVFTYSGQSGDIKIVRYEGSTREVRVRMPLDEWREYMADGIVVPEDIIDNSILTFQEVYASSAAELVTEIIQYTQNEVELSEVEAEALYAGIMMDTKNFTFKTGVRTFEAAAYLRRCGVDIIKVKKWFQSDLESYNTISEIVRKAEIVRDSIGISIYDVQEKETSLICAKAADELLTIGNITASFVLGLMEDGKVCISGRSIGDVNVQMILEKLGGGGHITLAGAQLENVTIDEAKQELISKINEYFEEKE